jgi:hypothetical protein
MSLKIIKRQPWTLASNTPLAQSNSDTQSDTTSFPIQFFQMKNM